MVLIPVALLGWWLVSPLFISTTVEEELPFSVSAVVPKNMSRTEVEQVMADMAKVNHKAEEKMTSPMRSASRVKTGHFRDADSFHKGSGQATIYRLPDASHILRLENLNVTNGPDLHVILTPHQNPASSNEVRVRGYVNLGKLKGNIGNQNYGIPVEVDINAQKSVVIYCKAFHVLFSIAQVRNGGQQ